MVAVVDRDLLVLPQLAQQLVMAALALSLQSQDPHTTTLRVAGVVSGQDLQLRLDLADLVLAVMEAAIKLAITT